MLQKKYKNWASLLLVSVLLLFGCAREEENVINASENVSAYTTSIIQEFNNIKNNESNLQQEFEENIKTDEELNNFKNKSASVFKNVENRQHSLNVIKNKTKDLENTKRSIEELNFDALDERSVTDMCQDIQATLDLLNSYTADYQEVLNHQQNYFTSLGQDEATFETFKQGIEDMADEDQALLSTEHNLNQSLVKLEDSSKIALDVAREQFKNDN